MESFSKIVAMFLAVLLLFFWPLYYISQKQEMITQIYVTAKSGAFVDNVRRSGRITINTYNNLLRQLSFTGNIYDIKMEQVKNVYYPLVGEDGEIKDYQIQQESIYQDEMLKAIYEEEGDYLMGKGDYFSFVLVNKNQTFSSKLQGIILGRNLDHPAIRVSLGGIIRDEID